MNYIAVRWLRQHSAEPTWLLSELDDERRETRKIEIFADGSKGYATKKLSLNEAAMTAIVASGHEDRLRKEICVGTASHSRRDG